MLNYCKYNTLTEENNVETEPNLIQAVQIWGKTTMTAKYGFLHYSGWKKRYHTSS